MKIRNYYTEASYIHYSNCHEDADFMLQHVQGQPKRILTVASALDNALMLLTLSPDEVTAFDFNDTQVALCNLKKCAMAQFSREEFVTFVGFAAGDRAALYDRLRPHLDEATRAYFDAHRELITEIGLDKCGRLEYYHGLFRRYILRFTHSKATIDAFMRAQTLDEQRRVYETRFNNRRFRLLFQLFFSKATMKLLGRDAAFFKYAEGSLASMLKARFDRCVDCNLNAENYYVQGIVFEQPTALPPYLREENYETIKQNLDRLQIKKVTFEEEIKRPVQYDFMYLSDIFEYMSAEKTAALSQDVANALTDGGQVMMYNMMIERHLSADLKETELDQTLNKTCYYARCLSYEKK